MENGKFTADALLYFFALQLSALTWILSVYGVVYRKEIAHTCNSYASFSELYARKFIQKLLPGRC